MTTILSFNWDSSNKNIEYFLLDILQSGILLPFNKIPISSKDDARKAINLLYNNIQEINNSIDAMNVIYRILFDSTVVHSSQKGYRPRPTNVLSDFILEHFKNVFESSNLRPQRRERLKGPELKKFKKSLNKWGLWTQRRGNAYEAHLWSYALEVKNGNFKGAMKNIWKLRKNIHQRINKAQTQEFERWFANL